MTREEAKDHILLGSALNHIAAGCGNNLGLSRLLGCESSRLFRLLSNCPKVRPVNDGRALTTWEMVP